MTAVPNPERYKLPDVRPTVTKKKEICGYKCYITCGFFDSDQTRIAEVYIKVAKHGSVIAGLLDGMTAVISTCLQYGVPWSVMRDRLLHHVFERNGDQAHTSLLDGIAKTVDEVIAYQTSSINGHLDLPVGPKPNGGDLIVLHTDSRCSEKICFCQGLPSIPPMSETPRLGTDGIPVFDDIIPVHGLCGGPLVTTRVTPNTTGIVVRWAVYEDGSEFYRSSEDGVVGGLGWSAASVKTYREMSNAKTSPT